MLSTFLLDQEVLDVEIVSFEVEASGNISVKLNKEVQDIRFKLNDILVDGTQDSSNKNIYKINGISQLKENKENVLLITDESNSFEESKTFVFKKLVAPTSLKVVAGSGNNDNEINSSNVKNVNMDVTFNGGNTNILPVILEVNITDSADEPNTLTLTKELTTKNINETISGDLSSLEEGTLTLKALVRDSEGNVSTVANGTAATKYANAPVVTYEKANRTADKKKKPQASITNLKSTNTNDTVYYLVKKVGEPAPTVADIIGNSASNTSKINSFNETTSIPIPTDIGDDACVVYLAAKTASGTDSKDVVAIKVAKKGANAMEGKVTVEKETSKEATYKWDFNEETEGFVEYRVILKDSTNKIVYETVVNKGETKEVDFFDILKEQDAGTFNMTVIAVADNEDYTDVSSTGVTITTSPVLTGITITLDKNEKKISWTPTGDVAKVKDYTVEILKYDSTKTNKEYNNVVSSATTTETSNFDISSIVEKYGAGTYSFKVTANAKDDVLMANKSSDEIKKASGSSDKQANLKYYQGARIEDLRAVLEDGKVQLKGTLLDSNNLFDILSKNRASLVNYKLYYVESDKDYVEDSTAITSLPYNVAENLNPGKEYKFMIVTEVNGSKYYSNEAKVTTPISALAFTNATYVKVEKDSPVLPKLGANQVTYKDNTLYVGEKMTEYSSDIYPEVLNIISVLDQMDNNDKISVNDKITALTLTDDDKKDTTYDLTKVAKTAKVNITGEANYTTTVTGELNEITVDTAKKFDLSELSVEKVIISKDNMDLTLDTSSPVNVEVTTGTTTTINGVKIKQESKINPFIVEGDKFTFTGSNNKLSIDSSKVEKQIDVEFVGTNQDGLEISANKSNAVRVFTNAQEITGLEVKSGKVDISKAVFKSLVVGDTSMSDKYTVTLITDKTYTGNTVVGEKLTSTPKLLDWFGYYLVPSVANEASYSVKTNSDEIEFTLNKKSIVTLNQKSETLSVEETSEVKEALNKEIMKEDDHNTEFAKNMDAINSVEVDPKTNTITVKIDKTKTKAYTSEDNASKNDRTYFALIVDTGISRDKLYTDGPVSGYQVTEDDVTASSSLDLKDTEILIWWEAELPEMTIGFKNKETNEINYLTIKVEDISK